MINYYLKDDDNWKHIPKTDDFIDYINPVDGYVLDKRAVDVKFRPLPFYEGIDLIRVYADKWNEIPEEEVCFFFARQGNKYIFLNGTSDAIYKCNEKGNCVLSKDTCADYLKFFCMFTVGDDQGNSFYIIEGDDSEFIHYFSQYDKDNILDGYKGIQIKEKDNHFLINARTMFGAETYDAEYEIAPNGDVQMLDDNPA